MSDDTLTIEIDGTTLEAAKGSMIIEVADAAGIYIPRFCYHKKLSVAANCRMCLVEVEKAPKPLPACATPVMPGMKVFTGSDLAVDAQRSVMEFLLINHPLDCPICDQGGECELQDLAMGYGKGVSRFQERKRVVPDENLGPLIATDMTRCIHCTRCIRFGVEIAGLPELGATGRGEHMRIGTFVERSVDSELSGNMIDVCPVGALTSKPFRYRARPWEMNQLHGVAGHDGVGSNIHVHVRGGRIMRVVPRDNEAINETWLSDRDRFSYEGLYSEDRLTVPRVKRDGRWVDVEWEEALERAAEWLRSAEPARIGGLASPSSTLEELYLAQKLLRGLGCDNLDHRLRALDFSDQEAVPVFPHLGQSLRELEDVDAALLVGSNARKEQPLANHRLRKAALRGASIMAVNPIDYDANLPLEPRIVVSPAALARELARLAKAVGASPELAPVLGSLRPGAVHRAIAERLHAAARPTVLLGHSALAHPMAAVLRALAGDVAAQTGAAFGSLADGANAAGAAIAGMLPHRGPWGAAVAAPGRHARAMLEEPLAGYLLINLEPEVDAADSAAARRAMEAASFVIALTPYVTPEMERYAEVLLPVTPFAETPGTFVNAEGTWQSFEALGRAPGDARPAWRVLRVLGNRLGLEGFEYRESTAVRDELAAAGPGPGRPDNRGGWRVPAALEAPAGGLWRCGEVPAYAVDAVVRRSRPLAQTADGRAACIRLNLRTARRLGVAEGARAAAGQDGARVELPVRLDEAVPDDCVQLPSGIREAVGLGPAFGPLAVEPVGAG